MCKSGWLAFTSRTSFRGPANNQQHGLATPYCKGRQLQLILIATAPKTGSSTMAKSHKSATSRKVIIMATSSCK